MIKKAIAFMLAVIMAFTMFGTAFADNERTSGLYTYAIKGNGTITITDYDWAKSEGDVYIPMMLDGYTVTAIGNNAFADGKQSVIVTLPNSITMIGEKAFANTAITKISIPSSVQSIGTGFVMNCPNLLQISADPTNANYASIDGALYHKATKTLVAYPVLCKATIPDGIVAIGDYACYGCSFGTTSLKKILPSSVIKLGDYSFAHAEFGAEYSNEEERNIVIPECIASVGNYAFESAIIYPGQHIHSGFGLAGNKVYLNILENENTIIGEGTFRYVKFYTSYLLYVYVNVAEIPDYAFYNIKKETSSQYELRDALMNSTIIVTETVKSVGEMAFVSDKKQYTSDMIRSILLDNPTLSRLGSGAFDYCHVYGKASVISDGMDGNAFSQTKEERFDYKVPDDYKYRKSSLSVEIVDNSTVIHHWAFMGCKGLSVQIPKTINNIEDGAFSSTEIYSIDLQSTTVSVIPQEAVSSSTLQKIQLPPSITEIKARAFANASLLVEIELPETLTTIGEEAFIGCAKLSEIQIPNTVTSIGDSAFERTLITLVVEENSYAALWAQENGYSYRYNGGSSALDWLNN